MKHFIILLLIMTLGILSCSEQVDQSSVSTTPKSLTPQKNRIAEIQKMGPGKYEAFHEHIRTKTGDAHPTYRNNYKKKELQKQLRASKTLKQKKLDWQERGPGNVAGRTRDIIYDKRDQSYSTWTVGSAGGGVWRTTDAGSTWTHLTADLPNLSTSSLVRSDANPDIIYVGTGDFFRGINGDGIYKSTDNGQSFLEIGSTSENPRFGNVTRMVISKDDPNKLWVSTIQNNNSIGNDNSSYILTTDDGGDTWSTLYSSESSIQQIVLSPDDQNILFASVNSTGIIRSVDGGNTWEQVYDASDNDLRRMELAIAPSDPDVIYLAGESISSILLKSQDGGLSWLEVRGTESPLGNWLGGQGWYDNSIAVHPYDETKLMVGGAGPILEINTDFDSIDIAVLNYSTATTPLSPETSVVPGYELALEFGESSLLEIDDLVDLNLVFSKGNSMAVRLVFNSFNQSIQIIDRAIIPVKATGKNGAQYTIGWVDTDDDSKWNKNTIANTESMESLLIFNISNADSTKESSVTENIFETLLYYVDPVLKDDTEEDPTIKGSISIKVDTPKKGQGAKYSPVVDGYSQYRKNFPEVGSKGVHVDHHNIVLIPIDSASGSFYILNANDGGIAFSKDGGTSFTQTGDTFKRPQDESYLGYNTSQFYGLDKMNGADRYVGGTQDNGSWVSSLDPKELSVWTAAPSGDGFEAAWHYEDSNLLLESSQFNDVYKSRDGGVNWSRVTLPHSEGPFVTRIANSKVEPDLVLMISDQGVLRSTDFGDSWEVITMPDNWFFGGFGAPIEISVSSPAIVWTGENSEALTVSADGGQTFSDVNAYDGSDLGPITAIATHPFNPNKAYILYSIQGDTKILLTDDLGDSWTDITGFGDGTGVSTNGFPDVATTSLVVMPYDTTIIWAGTEIGLFESTDGGASWHYADNGLPPVSIWEMKIVNDEVILATHGRGIWSVSIPELDNYEPFAAFRFPDIDIQNNFAAEVKGSYELFSKFDSSRLTLNFADGRTEVIATELQNPANFFKEFTFDLDEYLPDHAIVTAHMGIESYLDGEVITKSKQVELFKVNEKAQVSYTNDFESTEKGFATRGLEEKFSAGIQTNGLSSTHPYGFLENSIAILQTPIVINEESSSIFSYDEITLVEPGDSDDPESENFYDYVSIDATSNKGRDWVRVAKYDAQDDPDWANNFFQEDIAFDSLVRNRGINLAEFFSPGDTVFMRFRLVSDDFIEGWGWFIDNINYGEISTSVADISILNEAITISPNPARTETEISIEVADSEMVLMNLYDLKGQLVKEVLQKRLTKGKHSIDVDLSGMNPGAYLLQVQSPSIMQVLQIVKM